MPAEKWTILDAGLDDPGKRFEVSAGDLPGTPGGWSVTRERLRCGLADGVDLVEVNNGRLRFAVLPTRGMGLWRAWMDDGVLGWKSPVRGPVHPHYVPISEPGGLGWLAGFDELMVRCGIESNGAPQFDERGQLVYPLHGRIANLPAHFVEAGVDVEAGEIWVRGVVEECRVHFRKFRLTSTFTTSFAGRSIIWHDEVENIGGAPAGMQMLYHTNIGEPLLDAGSRLTAPVRRLAPRDPVAAEAGVAEWQTCPPPTSGSVEQVYFAELLADADDQTRVLLQNAAGTAGVGLCYSRRELPFFTQWRNTPAAADGYVMGLEPGTNFPNTRSFEAEQGRVVQLQPGETWQATVTLDWHSDPASVAKAAEAIAELQASHEPELLEAAPADWVPQA